MEIIYRGARYDVGTAADAIDRPPSKCPIPRAVEESSLPPPISSFPLSSRWLIHLRHAASPVNFIRRSQPLRRGHYFVFKAIKGYRAAFPRRQYFDDVFLAAAIISGRCFGDFAARRLLPRPALTTMLVCGAPGDRPRVRHTMQASETSMRKIEKKMHHAHEGLLQR